MCFLNFQNKCNFLEKYRKLRPKFWFLDQGILNVFFQPFPAPIRFFQTARSWNLCKPGSDYFGLPRKTGKWKVGTRFINLTSTSSTHLATNANVKAVQCRCSNSAMYYNFLIDRWVILCTRTKKVVCRSMKLFTFLLLKHMPHVRNEERLSIKLSNCWNQVSRFCLRVENGVKVKNCLLVFNVVYYFASDARTARCQSNYAIA